MKKILPKVVFSVSVLGAFTLLAFLPFYDVARWGMGDIFLRLKPPIPIHSKLRVVEIDDNTFEELRIYPLTRDLVARGIEKLAELGTEVLLVDSEYVEPSGRVVAEDYLNRVLPNYFQATFADLESASQTMFDGLLGRSRDTSQSYAIELTREWPAYLDSVREEMELAAARVAQNNDLVLGEALKFHGRAHVTVTPSRTRPARELSSEMEEYLADNISLSRLTVAESEHPIQNWEWVVPAILPVLSQAKGAGNVEQHIDGDGVRRRVDLLFQWNEKFYPHISFSSLLDWVGNPEILLYNNRIQLRQVKHPDGGLRDIDIPLDESGRMIIHWPAGRFDETFERVSFILLLKDEDFLERLQKTFLDFERLGWLQLAEGDVTPLAYWDEAEAIRAEILDSGDHTLLREFRNTRLRFVEACRGFLGSTAAEQILGFYQSELDNPANAGQADLLRENIAYAEEVFPASLELIQTWETNRNQLIEALEGNWISLGYTGRSTTDIGVNPFDPNYMNVGTMASIVNTVLQDKFLDEMPWYWSLLFMLPVVAFLPSLTRRLPPLPGMLLGVGALLGVMGIYFGVYVVTGVYFDAFFAFGVTLVSWLVSYVIHFLESARQAAWVKDMAGQYVSESVVDMYIANPSLLKLGGEKRMMTAIFTDVKGFSTISEQLSAEDLVRLLNEYLTEMSNIILEELGTIDKYEGDAIIAFFNAPHDVPDHAARACKSALLMKRAEEKLNPDWIERGMAPTPLFTRIGINSGDMVAGNMGTAKKKNYTIMGNHVNLAARLEGVNKQYGTHILISENTYEQLGGAFLCRRLDKVRVVGVTRPLRLFELVTFDSEADDELRGKIDWFHKCLDLFEARDYRGSEAELKKLLERFPDDGPAQTFLKRSQDYQVKAPPSDWDGVWNLTSK